jgi:hypothetical protein
MKEAKTGLSLKAHLGGVAAGLAVIAVTLPSPAVRADDACRQNSRGVPVPQCVTQSHSNTLKADHTEDINLYCPPEAPYYWGGWVDTFSSIWHVITENILVEDQHHARFKISNTRLGDNSYTVTIGCSPLSESGQCSGSYRNVPDPNCPRSDTRQDCMPPPNYKCWQTWTETCIVDNKVQLVHCTNANPLAVTCVTCD